MKKYQIIYADPPWKFKCYGKRGRGWKRAEDYYPLLSVEKLKQLPIKNIADENCILFLWSIETMLPEAFEIINAWGFIYKTVGFTWVKTNKQNNFWCGMGYWTHCNPEICLLATKGHIKRVSKSVKELIISPRRKHSQKPDEVRNRIVQLVGNLPRIELFAREKAEGWDVWGDEVKSDIKL